MPPPADYGAQFGPMPGQSFGPSQPAPGQQFGPPPSGPGSGPGPGPGMYPPMPGADPGPGGPGFGPPPGSGPDFGMNGGMGMGGMAPGSTFGPAPGQSFGPTDPGAAAFGPPPSPAAFGGPGPGPQSFGPQPGFGPPQPDQAQFGQPQFGQQTYSPFFDSQPFGQAPGQFVPTPPPGSDQPRPATMTEMANQGNPDDSFYPVMPSLPGNQGGPPPPQSPEPAPFFLDPRSPYAGIGKPAAAPKSRKIAKLVLIGVLVIIAIVIAFIFMQSQGQDDSGAKLENAISNSFSVNNFTEKVTVDKSNIELRQDASDNHNPRLSGTMSVADLGVKIDGYASLSDSFIKYTSLGSLVAADDMAAKLANKWVQIRRNGQLPSGYTPQANVEAVFDPRVSIYGDRVVGNFTSEEQATLTKEIKDKHVYDYDPTTVKTTVIDGQAATQYDITVNVDALKAFNKMAGQMAGISSADLDRVIAMASLDDYRNAKVVWYVADDSHQVIRIVSTESNKTVTVDYTDIGSTVLTTEPTAVFQYTDFSALLQGNATASINGKAEDTQRQTDIAALTAQIEAYYANYGFYPSLTNINDVTWRKANLAGLDDESLKDPKTDDAHLASAPAIGRYSYQVYKDKGLAACDGANCGYFKLTATLSDGTVFAKEAQ